MTTLKDSPRVYVGTYHKYNCGSIAGEWVDLTDFDNSEDFYNYCKELHKDEEDPEFMFQDYEFIPSHLVSEHGLSEDFWEYLEFFNDNDEEHIEAYTLFCENYGTTDISKFEESYQGNWEQPGSLQTAANAFLWEMIENHVFGEIPEGLYTYLDEEKMERDLFYDYTEIDGHIFWNNF